MDRHLPPLEFDVNPDAPNAAEEWKHFYRTFINSIHQYNEAISHSGDQQQEEKEEAVVVVVVGENEEQKEEEKEEEKEEQKEEEKDEVVVVVVGDKEEQEQKEEEKEDEQGQQKETEKEAEPVKQQEQEEQVQNENEDRKEHGEEENQQQQKQQLQYHDLPQQQQQQRKLQTLINCISPEIYEYISEAEDYYSAINILERLYTKPNSIIYNRHQLNSRKQNKDESVYQYMQRLEKLSNTCEFKAVSGEVYRQECVRDSFISGLVSTQIRDRLLENSNLTLKQAFNQAQELELAHKHPHSESTQSTVAAAAATAETDDTSAEDCSSRYQDKCFFCGLPRPHHRLKCYLRPAF